jgi:hypothetical protein
MNPRPKGVMTYHSPKNPIVEEAKRRQRQKQEQLAAARERRAEHPVPNYLCYRELFAGFDPKTHTYADGRSRRVPKCRVCEGNLYPMEHHVCDGFTPKFEDADKVRERWEARADERRERAEARREMIREAKANGQFYDDCEDDNCDVDYDEGDYCEGDDDGWECEDDGDPMYD